MFRVKVMLEMQEMLVMPVPVDLQELVALDNQEELAAVLLETSEVVSLPVQVHQDSTQVEHIMVEEADKTRHNPVNLEEVVVPVVAIRAVLANLADQETLVTQELLLPLLE
jgi:hypothetical protein